MTFTTGLTVIYTFWSPDGARLIYNLQEGPAGSLKPESHGANRRRNACLTLPIQPDAFRAFSWSPDGRKLSWLDQLRRRT